MIFLIHRRMTRSSEKILVKHPLVANAVIFGRGKFQNGVIIDPTPGHHIDPEDTEALAQFRREIW